MVCSELSGWLLTHQQVQRRLMIEVGCGLGNTACRHKVASRETNDPNGGVNAEYAAA
jgi:hypothetical protein